jgi:LysM repeat protein
MSPRPRSRTTTAVVAAALGSCALQAVPAAVADAGQAPAPQPERTRASATLVPTVAAPAPAVVALAAPVRGATTYTVRRGDTVGHIALRLGVSQSAIVQANRLDARGFIREGQTLVVPGAAAATAAPAAAPSSTYLVRRGDTLSHIAVRTGTTVAALRAANGLDARGFIREGQRLTVPGARASTAPATPAAATTGGTSTYTVRQGDTLSHIAARHGVSLTRLRAANPGVSDRLQIGQRVSVPSASTSSGTVGNSFAGRTYPAATVAAAQANKDALTARSVPTRAQMQAMVASTARAQGVDPALAQAIAYQESGFNMRAVSPANAVGVMQVIPSSGRWASEMAGRRLDLLHPQDNVLAGVLVLKANLRAAGDVPTAIAAYYQGLSSVRKNGMFADTRRYVASVQTLAARYR